MSTIDQILEKLRHRLLDLTSRNRLLNFKHPKGTSLKFEVENISDVYKRIVDDQLSIRIDGVPAPDLRPRPDVAQYAKSIGWKSKNELSVISYEDTLLALCRKIEREANTSISETGTNTLFLILGFVEYQDSRDSSVGMLAPLVSIPVKLERRPYRNNYKYYISSNGEEIQENLSLREKFKRDFNITLPDFDVENFSIESYLLDVKKAIRSQAAFSVNYAASLGLLSFSGMLMIKDLELESWNYGKGKNRLLEHNVLKELFGNIDDDTNEREVNFFEADLHDVDKYNYSRIPLVYDADHSQHSALIDVLELNKNLVIQGPPGTGKSQTITNIIAGALDRGKSVLFVAEKLAALEVVKHRLDQVGLSLLILELHSDKANKKSVLESIEKRLDHNFSAVRGIEGEMDSLQVSINDLNRYSEHLNEIIQKELHLSLYASIWRYIRLKEQSLPEAALISKYEVSDAQTVTRTDLDRRVDYLVDVGKALQAIEGNVHQHPFAGFFPITATPGLIVEVTDLIRDTNEKVSGFLIHVKKYDEALKSSGNANLSKLADIQNEITRWRSHSDATTSTKLLNLISSCSDKNGRFKTVTSQLTALEKAIKVYTESVTRYDDLITDDQSINSADYELLEEFFKVCKHLDVELKLNQLEQKGRRFGDLAQLTQTTQTKIADLLSEYSLDLITTTADVKRWINIVEALQDLPLNYYHHQSITLCQQHSQTSLQLLINLRQRINELESSLSKKLYFDQLPSKQELSTAIRTLRVGTEWYRYFNSEYRRALSLHKSMDRNKRSLSAHDRLKEMEDLVELIDSKIKWNENPAWADIIQAKPSMDYNLESLLRVSEWNKRISNAINVRVSNLNLDWLQKIVSIVKDGKLKKLSELLRRLNELLIQLNDDVPTLANGLNRDGFLAVAAKYQDFSNLIGEVYTLVKKHNSTCTTIEQFKNAVSECLYAKSRFKELNDSTEYTWLGSYYKGADTDVPALRKCVETLDRVHNLSIPSEFKFQIATSRPFETAKEITDMLSQVEACTKVLESFESRMSSFGSFKLDEWTGASSTSMLSHKLENLLSKGESALKEQESIHPWVQYWSLRNQANNLKVEVFVEGMEAGLFHPDDVLRIYLLSFYNSLLSKYFKKNPSFNNWTRERLEQLRKNLNDRDKSLIKNRGRAIAAKLNMSQYEKIGVNSTYIDKKTEWYLVEHLKGQQRPRVPIRKLLQRAPITMQQIKPCFMMSPQSVVKYLTPNQIEFDLLVMDEASQLRPEEAISAVVRAKQVVVVGDSKQLPPTSFFQTSFDDSAEDDEEATTVTDTESILEVGARAFGNIRSLGVHYRSRHHTLISFSNHKFYDNRLILFPSPYELNVKYGVRAIYLSDARYEKGINPIEAQKVVDLILDHLRNRTGESLGVAAVNLRQRDMIDDLLDKRLMDDPDLAKLKDKMPEPLFIKNLENVQGDERDVIIVSTTYGPNPNTNVVQQRFGPIGYENGWRRLNVLFTRARNSLILCTSLRPHDIVVDENSKMGVKIFKYYLEYIQRGGVLDEPIRTDEPESAFEESVIKTLEVNGYDVVPQLGAAGYRIDIAVRHPEHPGVFLAAIECDGAAYHTTRSARERDRIRQEVLEHLGWKNKIWRIWSTDWFKRPNEEKRKLLEFLRLRLSQDQEVYPPISPWESTNSDREVPVQATSDGVRQAEYQLDQVSEELSQAIFENEVVEIGDTLIYCDLERPQEQFTATIIRGTTNVLANKLNYDSPFANAVLGSSIGDVVDLHLRDKVKKFKILQIEKPSVD